VRRVIGVVGLLTALILVACAPASGAVSETPLSGPHVFGWGFRYPEAVASDGTHVWVANSGGDSVTELSASSGALVKVISGSAYQFDEPGAIASDGTNVWVANADQSVTGFPAS
jgi:DNA-binding beta-propeller fold protein YncE